MLCSYYSIVIINDSNTTLNQIYTHKRMLIVIFTYYSIHKVRTLGEIMTHVQKA